MLNKPVTENCLPGVTWHFGRSLLNPILGKRRLRSHLRNEGV